MMLVTEVTVASISKIHIVNLLPNILFDILNGNSLIVNGNYIKVIKALLKGVHFTFPSIIINSHFKD